MGDATSCQEAAQHLKEESGVLATPLGSDSDKALPEDLDSMSAADEKPAAAPGTKITPDSRLSYDELALRLDAALQRVEALEARLEEKSSGMQNDMESLQSRVVAVEVKTQAMPKNRRT